MSQIHNHTPFDEIMPVSRNHADRQHCYCYRPRDSRAFQWKIYICTLSNSFAQTHRSRNNIRYLLV